MGGLGWNPGPRELKYGPVRGSMRGRRSIHARPPNIVAALEPSRMPDAAKHVRARHRSGNDIYNPGASVTLSPGRSPHSSAAPHSALAWVGPAARLPTRALGRRRPSRLKTLWGERSLGSASSGILVPLRLGLTARSAKMVILIWTMNIFNPGSAWASTEKCPLCYLKYSRMYP